MNPTAHLASVSALRDFQAKLVRFRHEAETVLTAVGDISRTEWHQLENAYSIAVGHHALCLDRVEEAARQYRWCLERADARSEWCSCQSEQQQLAEATEHLVCAEGRVLALRVALDRLSAAIEAFRIERACLETVLSVDLSAGDQFLRMKLASVESYLAEAHRR